MLLDTTGALMQLGTDRVRSRRRGALGCLICAGVLIGAGHPQVAFGQTTDANKIDLLKAMGVIATSPNVRPTKDDAIAVATAIRLTGHSCPGTARLEEPRGPLRGGAISWRAICGNGRIFRTAPQLDTKEFMVLECVKRTC